MQSLFHRHVAPLGNQTLPCCAGHITATVTSSNHKSIVAAKSPYNTTNIHKLIAVLPQKPHVWVAGSNLFYAESTHASSESEPLYVQERTAHGTTEFMFATKAAKSREKHQDLARAQCRFLPHTTCPASENASVAEAYCQKTIWHQRHPHTATNDNFVSATNHCKQTRMNTATSDKALKCRNCHAETSKKSLTAVKD